MRCDCCGQNIRPKLPLCVCGHPMNSHHHSTKGNPLYCTVASPHPCPCEKGTVA